MSSPLAAIAAIGLGVYFVVSRDWISRSALEWDHLVFGSRAALKWYQIGSVLSGLLFIMLGLLSLSGLIELAPQL